MKRLVVAVIVGSFAYSALATTIPWQHYNFVGNPTLANGFDATSAVSQRSMHEKGGGVMEGNARPMLNTINGAGMYYVGGQRVHTGAINDPEDTRSSYNGVTMGFQDGTPTGEPNPRGGTVAGSQWAEFGFDQPYDIKNVHIWNYNEGNQAYWAMQGMREVTIEVTNVGDGAGWGSTDASDWSVIFDGELAMGGTENLEAQVLSVPSENATFQYLVITSGLDDTMVNYMDAVLDGGAGTRHSIEAGLSEIMFEIVPEPSTLALLGLGALAMVLRRRR